MIEDGTCNGDEFKARNPISCTIQGVPCYKTQGEVMKRIKFLVLGLLIGGLLCLTVDALAQLTVGNEADVRAPLCKTEASAVEMAKADSKSGIQAALEVLKAKDDCGMGQFRARVIKIVFSAETERGLTVRVVEVKIQMQDESWETWYLLTDTPVKLSGLST